MLHRVLILQLNEPNFKIRDLGSNYNTFAFGKNILCRYRGEYRTFSSERINLNKTRTCNLFFTGIFSTNLLQHMLKLLFVSPLYFNNGFILQYIDKGIILMLANFISMALFINNLSNSLGSVNNLSSRLHIRCMSSLPQFHYVP